MATELPDIVAGKPVTIDRLHLAAGVCGWIMDGEVDPKTVGMSDHLDADTLAEVGRAYLVAAIRKQAQEDQRERQQ